MRRMVVRWLLAAIPLILGVSVLTFVLASLIPGDAARTILGVDATPEQYEALREQLRLNDPLWKQYGHWFIDALHGDLGQSIQSADPVAHELAGRLGVTLSLVVGATVVSALVGVGLGVASALRGGVLGRCIDALSLLGFAVPSYWLGLVLVALLAVQLPLFPATGYVPFAESPVQWFESLVLPVVTLGLGGSAPIAKQTRDGVLAELDRDYVLVLRARGLTERSIIFKHVLRNAATPVVSVVGLVVIGLFGGAVLAETVFVLPGLGGLAVTATATHDIPLLQGIAVLLTLLIVAVNLVVEFGYAALNPKVRT
jgi:peptide/nickel transport system permease protein